MQKRLRISNTTIILLLSKRNQLKRYLLIQGSSHVYIVPLSMALRPVGLHLLSATGTTPQRIVQRKRGRFSAKWFSFFSATFLTLDKTKSTHHDTLDSIRLALCCMRHSSRFLSNSSGLEGNGIEINIRVCLDKH